LDVCYALEIECVVTMSRNHSVQDVVDLVDYAYGDATTAWGSVRINNDSHPKPYRLTGVELGNEQANDDWVDQIQAMEARAAAIGLGTPSPFYYLYPESTLHGGDVAALKAANFPAAKVMADTHVGWGGGREIIAQNFKIAGPDYNVTGINCEVNGMVNVFSRALEEAADLIDFDNAPSDEYARTRARMSSFLNERSGHFTKYDQGLSFWLPNMTWITPPGYVHVMTAPAVGDFLVPVTPASPSPFNQGVGGPVNQGVGEGMGEGGGPPLGPIFTYSASRTADGTAVFLRLLNNFNVSVPVSVAVNGLSVTGVSATVLLSPTGNMNATNSPSTPTLIAPAPLTPQPQLGQPIAVPAYSYVIVNFTGTAAWVEAGEE
jgi:alpha-L-arabinofuranosidase